MPEMFTDEHALDYSSPPLYDDCNDDLDEFKSDTVDAYNDPFDSKEDEIKESKLLIDELDPLRSSDFLSSPEYDSFIFEDFSKVDALPSTNNEDKDFDPPLSLYELSFHKEVHRTETLLSFSYENEEKLSNRGFLLLKEFILLLSQKYLIGSIKFSKSLKFLKARWRFFLALLERTFVSWMFLVSISIPHERINSGVGNVLRRVSM
nr:hypothetical protein [Tanacetum cinerariifolium]